MVLTVAASSRCKPVITIGTRTEGWGGKGTAQSAASRAPARLTLSGPEQLRAE